MIKIQDNQNQNFNLNIQNYIKQQRIQSLSNNTNQSEVSDRINYFKVSIRNRQINEYKSRIRKQQISIKQLQQMIQNLPKDNQSTSSWASKLSEIYSQTAKYTLTPDKVVQLFKLVQKFPNQLTLRLLQIIIVKSDVQTIDLMFQYDVIRLLHSFLNYSNNFLSDEFDKNDSISSGQEIINQIVVISQAVKKVQQNSCCEYDQAYYQKVQMVRTVLRILSQLCRKKKHIRNFAILNHKSYTYCLKSYKNFKKDIQIEFIAFLQSITLYPFQRYDQQFNRIIDKIFRIFFNQIIQLKIQILQQKTNRNYLSSYEYLIIAITNLLKMRCSWILQRFFGYLHEKKQPKIIHIILNLVNQCNYIFGYPTIDQVKEELLPNKLFYLVIQLFMNVIEVLQVKQIFSPKNDQIYFALVQFLRKGQVIMNSDYLTLARRGIFFVLSNYFYNKLSKNLIYNLLVFDQNDNQKNLIGLTSNFLQLEHNHDNKLQLFQLISSIFVNIPLNIIENMLASSEILSIITEKLLQKEYFNRSNNATQIKQKNWYLTLLSTFFQKYQQQDQQKFYYYRQTMLETYRGQLQQMINSYQTNQDLSNKINYFIYQLQSGFGQK